MPGADWQITLADQTSYVTDPTNPCAGQPFTVSWMEINVGSGPSEAYRDTFELNSFSAGWSSQDLDVTDPVQPGDTPWRSLTFTLAAADTYNMNLTIDGVGMYLGDVIVNDCSS
ncbi:MAG TPA: hypothetical protein VN636_12240 [Acidimicrobiia bacterium]|nr:hypothetical protein [Acidimicrobiia bacterium]